MLPGQPQHLMNYICMYKFYFSRGAGQACETAGLTRPAAAAGPDSERRVRPDRHGDSARKLGCRTDSGEDRARVSDSAA